MRSRACATRNKDLTGWLEYFVQGLTRQLEEVKQRGRAVIQADVMGRAHDLAAREVAVLAAIDEAGSLALHDLEPLFPKVSRRSLQRDLKHLLDIGLIREVGSTAVTDPNRSYAPVVDQPQGTAREVGVTSFDTEL